MCKESEAIRADENYEDRSFSMLRANFQALLLVGPPVAIATAFFVSIHGWPALYLPVDQHTVLSLALVVIGIVIHEILHALAWQIAARPPSGTVRLGFSWKALTPYAHCSVPMSARSYRIGAAAPGLVLGVVPLAVGLALGWGGWMMFGMLFTLAAGGDVLILWILRGVASDREVLDHPSRAGCLLRIDPARTPTGGDA